MKKIKPNTTYFCPGCRGIWKTDDILELVRINKYTKASYTCTICSKASQYDRFYGLIVITKQNEELVLLLYDTES